MAEAKTTCLHTNCHKPARCRGYCSNHYQQRRESGFFPTRPKSVECDMCGDVFAIAPRGVIPSRCKGCRRLRPKSTECKVCGDPLPETVNARVESCSHACRLYWSRHQQKRPTLRQCSDCGATMDMRKRDVHGDLVYRRNASRCSRCQARTRPHRYGMTATQVAHRDGAECRWCGEIVDLSLVGTRSKWAPSVDHIVPWSRGGTNAPENLQLMHRVCNAQKGTRQE